MLSTASSSRALTLSTSAGRSWIERTFSPEATHLLSNCLVIILCVHLFSSAADERLRGADPPELTRIDAVRARDQPTMKPVPLTAARI